MTSKAALIAIGLFILAAPLSPASATEGGPQTRECKYDYPTMTAQECRAYRMKVLKAKPGEERAAVYAETRRALQARAKEKGIAWSWSESREAHAGASR